MQKLAITCFALSGLLAWSSSGLAQSLPSTTSMACNAARRLVSERGAIVLGTGGMTYDRYVRDGGFCTNDEYAKPGFVASADNPQCFIGYYCFPKEDDQDR